MIAKPLLRTAVSWIAIAAFAAACATPQGGPGAVSNNNAPLTAESAATFVQAAEEELMRRSEYEGRVA